MAEKVASLYAEIGANTTGLEKGLARTKSGLGQASQQFGKFGGVVGQSIGTLAMLGGGLSVAGVAVGVMTKAIRGAIAEASEAEQVQARLNAVLQSTQGAAGLTADEINNMAKEMSRLTAVDDEAIVSAQSMLLTFTKIGRDVFPEATMAVLNMATVFGSLDQAAVQVGKALQDPITGMTALRRVGVNFDETAKDIIAKMVKMGDTAGAQRFILEELNTEFGGQAAAQAQTYAGSIKQIGVSLGNLGETVGSSALPQLSLVNLAIADAIDGVTDLIVLMGMLPQFDMGGQQGGGQWLYEMKDGVMVWTNAVDENSKSHVEQAAAIRKAAAESQKMNNIATITGKNMGMWGKNLDEMGGKSIPVYVEALKYARDDLEKVEIAQMLWGDSLKNTNKEALEAQRYYKMLELASGDLDEVTRGMIESDIQLIDTKIDVIDTVDRLKKGFNQAGEAAEEAQPRIQTLFDMVDTNLGSPMKAFIDDLKWFMAGGATFTKAFEGIKTAFLENEITPEEAQQMTEALFIEFEDEMANAGLQSKDDAQKNITEALGIPIDEAKAKMDEFSGALDVITSASHELNFEIVVSGETWVLKFLGMDVPAGGGGGGGGGGKKGKIKQEQTGGPVWQGFPYIVGEAGPELFVPNTSGRIVPNNQMGKGGMGGDTINIYNNSTGAAALTMAIIAQNHRARLQRGMGG